MSPQPSMYILDTNVLSELARKRPNPTVLDWLSDVATAISIPFSAVFEIERGICNLRERNAFRASQLTAWLDSLLSADLPILGIDAPVARQYATMTMVPALRDLWATPPKSKHPRPVQDLAIAAISIVRDAPIATLNTKDFVRIDQYFPLPGVFNPAIGEWSVSFEGSMVTPHWQRNRAMVDRALLVCRTGQM